MTRWALRPISPKASVRALIIGGAASGKSVYAEHLACSLRTGGPLIYLATMTARDPESRLRVERHRLARAGKGFETVERGCELEGLRMPQNAVVLLEDLGNLAANELFSEGLNSDFALQRTDRGVAHLEATARHLLVVGNDLFSGGMDYDSGTACYLRLLGSLQNRLSSRFDLVVEVVCGLPVIWKGEEA